MGWFSLCHENMSAPAAFYLPRVAPRHASRGTRRAHLAIAQQWSANHRNLTRAGVYPPRRSIKRISLSLITVSSFKRASKICDFWKATAETKLPPLLLDNKNRAIPQGCDKTYRQKKRPIGLWGFPSSVITRA